MTSQEINPMEGEIFTAENSPEGKKPEEAQKPKAKKHFSLPKPALLVGKLKNLKDTVRKPKILAILTLIIIIPIIYIAFIALSASPNSQPAVDVITPDTQNSDTPIDQEQELIENKIKSFKDDLELLETDIPAPLRRLRLRWPEPLDQVWLRWFC